MLDHLLSTVCPQHRSPPHSKGHRLSQGGMRPGSWVGTARPRGNKVRKSYGEAFLEKAADRRYLGQTPKPHLPHQARVGGVLGEGGVALGASRSWCHLAFSPEKDRAVVRGGTAAATAALWLLTPQQKAVSLNQALLTHPSSFLQSLGQYDVPCNLWV